MKMTNKAAEQPPRARWPDAAPLFGEEVIFSIFCGDSHLHWATHHGSDERFDPRIFWRTPHLKAEDVAASDLLPVLSRNLPDDPYDYVFGDSSDAAPGDAEAQSTKRAAELISVYVLSDSSGRGQEALLAKIWKTVPSRVFVMRGEDFREGGENHAVGTDGSAALAGAVHLYGHPALVFDGGFATTYLTYSATDRAGKFLGGGIGPGIRGRFQSLAKDADALPAITSEEVTARVNEALEKGRPLPTFATNIREAMMADAFREFALKGRGVIGHWLDEAYRGPGAPAEAEAKVNDRRRVLCTGEDGDILMQLLQPHGRIIEHAAITGTNSKSGLPIPRYVVESSKHLIHYGVARVLAAQVISRRSKDGKNPLEEHVGKRVAKMFDVEADDGDNIFRGTVIKAIKVEGGELEFAIQYDDGDSEDVAARELLDMFELFKVHGEKKKAAQAKGKHSNQKVPQSQEEPGEKAPGEKAPKSKAVPAKDKAVKGRAAPAKEKATKEESTRGRVEDPKNKAVPNTRNDEKDKAWWEVEAEKAITKRANSEEEKAVEVPRVAGAEKRAERKRSSWAPTGAKKPAKKKSKSVDDIVALVSGPNPHSFVRRRVAKDFDGETYFGTIMEYDDSQTPAYWSVEYDDGDEEDYSKKDLIKALKHYEKSGVKDNNKIN